MWGAFGLALMVAYWPGISGVATTPRWDVAALLTLPLFFASRIRMTTAHWFGLSLIVWMFATLLWSEGGADSRLDGVDNGLQIVIAGIAFVVGSTIKDFRPLIIGAAIGIGINNALALGQEFGYFGPVQITGRYVAGLFYNPLTFASAAAIVAVVCVSIRKLTLLPLVLPALIMAPSRAAWLALIVGLVSLTRYAWAYLGLAVFAAIGIAVNLPLFDITLDASSSERLMMWHDTILNLNWFGHGLGSFRECFIQFAHFFDIAKEQTRPEHPHNEWLWLAFEGGLPAVVLGAVFACSLWRASLERPEIAVLVTLLVLSFFGMPFHEPATLVFGALCAGFIAADRFRPRVVTVDCGIPLRPWLAAS